MVVGKVYFQDIYMLGLVASVFIYSSWVRTESPTQSSQLLVKGRIGYSSLSTGYSAVTMPYQSNPDFWIVIDIGRGYIYIYITIYILEQLSKYEFAQKAVVLANLTFVSNHH